MCSYRRLALVAVFSGLAEAANSRGKADGLPQRGRVRSRIATFFGKRSDPTLPTFEEVEVKPVVTGEESDADILEIEMLNRISGQRRDDNSKSSSPKVKLDEVQRPIVWTSLYSSCHNCLTGDLDGARRKKFCMYELDEDYAGACVSAKLSLV